MIPKKGDYVAVDHMLGTIIGFTDQGWPIVKPDPLWNPNGEWDEGLPYPPWRIYIFMND